MKITWFGGTCFRVYVGGTIVVVDPRSANEGIKQAELLSGADHVVTFGALTDLPRLDLAALPSKPAARPIEVDWARSSVDLFCMTSNTLAVMALGECPLILSRDGVFSGFTRSTVGAVIVLTDISQFFTVGNSDFLRAAHPRLVALASDMELASTTVEEIAERVGGAGLISLAPGLALEV